MFEKEEFDSFSVSTPEHMRGVVGLSAVGRGPGQARLRTEASRRQGRRVSGSCGNGQKTWPCTQMGQLTPSLTERMAVELLHAGAIGLEAHAFSHKNWGDDNPIPEAAVPANLDWELWCGSARKRPYRKGRYHPGNWRQLASAAKTMALNA